MRRITGILLIILFALSAYGQNQPGNTTNGKTPAAEEKKADVKPAGTEEKKTDTGGDATGDKISTLPEGYANLTWGTYLSDAKDKINGRLTYTDDKTVIISKENELQYYYGFFYKEPETAEKTAVKTEDTTGTADTTGNDGAAPPKDEGRLFYVSLNFPYLDKDAVYEKIKTKYGVHSGETLKDNQGAIAWDSEKTVVLMWVDRYENKPYCRRIIYISKDISKELNDYTNTIFNKTEIELMKKLNP
ncbi:MAG TPA: hypothetical protein P5120_09335 [Spirochaetota bacterium]|nr:hypothetical protein [Spirochaetota bacterium]HPF06677.1 hypothetical protein [Spirochaetota bacterium]HPJ41734.1 hypothetical protein [Spirochaetota bacterium]HPR36645.1 hypothetical protein [Spirochaetota bacterium]HRX47710.1 hypothetical protein [Spirochaetota bacterium]